MEISIILTNDSGSLQAVIGQFLETAIADTYNDRVLAQVASQSAQTAASSASDSMTEAAMSASAAAGSATGSATSASAAAASASAASTARDGAELQATYAQQSATAAANSQTSAANSASAAATSASNAANSASQAAATLAGAMLKANNLSDVANTASARSNIAAAGTGVSNTFTADQTIGKSSPRLILNDTGAGGTFTRISFQLGGVNAWEAGKGTGTTPNWSLYRYDASGTLVDTPISVNYSTGLVSMGSMSLSTALSVASGGTGAKTFTTNGVMLGNGGSTLSVTSAGTTGTVLTGVTGSTPTFQAIPNQPGRLIGVQIFTSSGTYTQTTGTNSVIVDVQGAGGASGGATATGAGVYSVGAPGSSGGFVRHRMTSGFSGASVVIGAAGVPSSGAAGGNGGSTSFGSITAGGGGGGGIAAASATVAATSGAPGSATGGNILNVPGRCGQTAWGYVTAPLLILTNGADSVLGSGGQYASAAGQGYGAGGGATGNGPSLAAKTGFAGSQGIVIVWEYA